MIIERIKFVVVEGGSTDAMSGLQNYNRLLRLIIYL